MDPPFRGPNPGRQAPKVVGRLLNFLDPSLEAAYLQGFNAQQVAIDALLLAVDIAIHLAMTAGLLRSGGGAVAWIPLFFVAADAGRLCLIWQRRTAYIRRREWLVGLVQPLYFVQAAVVMRHGIYFCSCRSRASFWVLHPLSSAVLYLVMIPLGMPLRYRAMLPGQAAALLPVVAANSLRCDNALACCTAAAGWYEQAAGLLQHLVALVPFPTAMDRLQDKAACIGVQLAAQVVVGFCIVASFVHSFERRRRAVFARQAGRPDVVVALLRRRQRIWSSVFDVFLVFASLWQVQSLVLPALFS